MTERKGDRKFKEREVKGILKVALNRKYASQNQLAQQGLSFSELSEIAKEGEIGQEDLTEAVKEYEKKRSGRRATIAGLAVLTVLGAGITWSVRDFYSGNQRGNELVSGTVISAVTGKDDGTGFCPEYNLEFRVGNGNVYNAGVVCTFDNQVSRAKRDLIKPGSGISTTRTVLEDFTKVAPKNIFAGTMRYEDLAILKP